MKKIAAILLCCLFLYNISGYYISSLFRGRQIKREMKAFIRSEEGMKQAEKIYIPDEQFESSVRFVEENEFIYKDNLYDLIKKETTTSGIILYCINDKKEELLIKNTKEQTNRNHDQNTAGSSIIKNIIKEAFTEIVSFGYYPELSKLNLGFRSPHIYAIHLQVSTPPPKSIS